MLNLISKANLAFTSNKDCGCDKKVSKSKNININTKITNKKIKLKNKKKTKKHSKKNSTKHSKKNSTKHSKKQF
jgi:hypothetical protein